MENENVNILNVSNKEPILDENFKNPKFDNIVDDEKTPNSTQTNNLPTYFEKNINSEFIYLNNIDNTTNCLALAVKEDYHIIVVKNFLRKSFRVSWKVTLSIFAINFLGFFL